MGNSVQAPLPQAQGQLLDSLFQLSWLTDSRRGGQSEASTLHDWTKLKDMGRPERKSRTNASQG
jgi:hypothetical protein